jgi:hypothetical protein
VRAVVAQSELVEQQQRFMEELEQQLAAAVDAAEARAAQVRSSARNTLPPGAEEQHTQGFYVT